MYNKLFTKILDSSIWLEDNPTRIVWLTFIAAMDEHGFCSFASAANVARRAVVTLKEAKTAIEKFERPDPDSGDSDNEGRRLERVPGGWIVLNATKYRDMVTRAIVQQQTRERVRKHRAGKARNAQTVTSQNSNANVTPSEAVSEAVSVNTELANQREPRRLVDPEMLKKVIEKHGRRMPKNVRFR